MPPNQTASPVQFGQVLTALQSRHARGAAHLPARVLARRSSARARAGFNQAIKHWEDAYRNTSQVQRRHARPASATTSSACSTGQAKVFGALSQGRGRAEGAGHRPQPDGRRASPRQEDNLKAAIPELRDVFREGRPALASLNRALPEIRGFARDALPGARSSSADARRPAPVHEAGAPAGRRPTSWAACRASCARRCPTSRA